MIFLDFDGVLNSARYLAGRKTDGPGIDPTRMALLKQIVDATGAGIVLSTSWREHWSKEMRECDSTGLQIHRLFSAFGMRILDKTPELRTRRETEILRWLEEHPEVRAFVVLDDRFLSAEGLRGRFVKTSNFRSGLDETDVQRAIEILNRQEGSK